MSILFSDLRIAFLHFTVAPRGCDSNVSIAMHRVDHVDDVPRFPPQDVPEVPTHRDVEGVSGKSRAAVVKTSGGRRAGTLSLRSARR